MLMQNNQLLRTYALQNLRHNWLMVNNFKISLEEGVEMWQESGSTRLINWSHWPGPKLNLQFHFRSIFDNKPVHAIQNIDNKCNDMPSVMRLRYAVNLWPDHQSGHRSSVEGNVIWNVYPKEDYIKTSKVSFAFSKNFAFNAFYSLTTGLFLLCLQIYPWYMFRICHSLL